VTEDLTSITLSWPQSEILRATAKRKIIVAGRRLGKSYIAVVLMLLYALREPNRNIQYLAPTFDQAKSIAWLLLLQLTPENAIRRSYKTDLRVVLTNGSSIRLRGIENVSTLRGEGVDLIVLDEAQLMQELEEIWDLVIVPTLAEKDRIGDAVFIGTPDGMANDFYKFYRDAERGYKIIDGNKVTLEDWQAFHYRSIDGGRIPEAELEKIRSTLDQKRYSQEFLADFVTLGRGRVYSTFNPAVHVRDDIQDDPEKPLLIGQDFNVSPMSSVVFQKVNGQIHVQRCVCLYDSTVSEMCEEIKRLYPGRKITVAPDPSGGRRTALGVTAHQIIKQHGFDIHAMTDNLKIMSRVDNVLANLRAVDGTIRLCISDHDCDELILALTAQQYDKRGWPEKNNVHDHVLDALGYGLWRESNLLKQVSKIIQWQPI